MYVSSKLIHQQKKKKIIQHISRVFRYNTKMKIWTWPINEKLNTDTKSKFYYVHKDLTKYIK